MKRIRNLIILLFLICSAKLFAYDYPWPVDYRFNVSSKKDVTKVNEVVEKFIYDNPEFYVYRLDWDAYYTNQPNGRELGIKNNYYTIDLQMDEQEPFGRVLQGRIYIEDVKCGIIFSVLPTSEFSNGSVILRLYGYDIGYEVVEGQRYPTQNRVNYGFNDVEPTAEETRIKESFEKNFLARLPLETEYIDPGSLDKNLSKILRFLKKWKIKYIFIIGIIILIIRIIYVICRNIVNKVEERKFSKKQLKTERN